MRRATSSQILSLAAMLASLVLTGCGSDDDHGGGTQNPSTNSRPWLDESEFDQDPSLHAQPGQTVVLHLDPTEPGAGLVQHTLRYMIDEDADLMFCIPEDDPHLRELEMVAESLGDVMLRIEAGDECLSVRVPAGAYELQIAHDGTNIPPGGAKAFLHHPQRRAEVNPAVLADGSGSGLASFDVPDFMAFRYAGNFVTTATTSPLLALQATATSVDSHAVFRFSGGPTRYGMADGTGAAVKTQSANCAVSGPIFVGDDGGPSEAQTFEFSANTPGRFGFCVAQTFCGGDVACIFATTQTGPLQYNDNGKAGTVFDWDYRGYDCTTTCDSSTLPLAEGEVALFAEEDYGGHAVVFRADVPKFSIYNAAAASGLAIGNDMLSSIRVGPNTLATLYVNGNYGGGSVVVGADTPTLAGTAVGNKAVSSMHINIVDITQYVVEQNGCEGCILAGIDLCNLDLTGANFAGARLSGANLSGSRLREASFDNATLSGDSTNLSASDFTFSSLHCTDLSETDLSNTTFGSFDNYLVVVDGADAAILRTDPVTGDRVVLSGSGTGSGTNFVQPNSIAVEADGNLIVADQSLPGIFRVNPSNGTRNVVSSESVGTGPTLQLPTDVAIDGTGQLYVVDALAMLFRINPNNGARTLISGAGTGSGTELSQPDGIAVDATGQLIVVDRGLRALLSVNPSTGARSVLSSDSTGTGPTFAGPVDIAIDDYGNLYVADLTLPGVFQVDPDTGNRTVLSGSSAGSGTDFVNVVDVTLAVDGTLFVTDEILGVVRVEHGSGDRTVISNTTTGGGPVNSAPTGIAFLSPPLLTLDFSCRLNLTSGTLDASELPVGYWRYMNLTDAQVVNATSVSLSTLEGPVDLSGALLTGTMGLTGAVLDGVDLGCATPTETERNCSQLIGTVLTGASLKGANLSDAALNGAKLIHANLEQADLSGAQLLKAPTTNTSAILDGAYLKNANLSEADLSGASFINSSWYSRGSVLCDGATWSGNCASGTGSTNLSNADFSGAYLAGVDLSGSTSQQVNFSGAVLVGAHFNSANLSGDPNTGARTEFNGAFLQGANFDSADLTGANFTDAYIDLQSSSGLEMIFQLPTANLEFTGYTPPASPPECVVFTTNAPTTTPQAGVGYTCPDGTDSPCSDENWQCPTCVPDSSSVPPTSIDGTYPGSCTHLDFKW